MSLYAYCVTRLEKDEDWAVFSGVADRPVFALRHQKVALLASRMERVRLEEPRHVVQHGQVVRRIFEQRTVLPFRFGTLFATEAEATALLRQNHDQFLEAIRRLRGKAELHVKVQFSLDATPPATRTQPGRLVVSDQGYGIASVPPVNDGTQSALTDLVTRRLREVLGGLDEQVSTRALADGQVHMDLRYLVERNPAPRPVTLAIPEVSDCHVQVTGPWPPYHFLPINARMPSRAERLLVLPGRQPLRARAARA
jgi:hypothetical protein